MDNIQLQLLFAIISIENKSKTKKVQKTCKQRKKPLVRQFKRPIQNRRANRHIFTNKDMKM